MLTNKRLQFDKIDDLRCSGDGNTELLVLVGCGSG